MKYLLFAALLLLAACGPSVPYDPAELRARASSIEDATARAAAYAQAAALEQQRATSAVATSQVMQITVDAGELALVLTRESSVATSDAAARYDSATAIAKVTDDAQNRLLFEQGLEYDRQKQQQEIVAGYAWLVVKVLMATAAVLALAVMIIMIARRPRNTHQLEPYIVDGTMFLPDQRLQSAFDKLLGLPAPLATVPPHRRAPQPEPMMLPPGEVQSITDVQEIQRLHLSLVSPSRSGKSTAMREIAAGRQNLIVVDPHYSPGVWPGAKVAISAANDINACLRWMQKELDRRRELRRSGQQRRFVPLTIMFDEFPIVAEEADDELLKVWHKWAMQSAKFNMLLILATQSRLVSLMGLKGRSSILENFYELELKRFAVPGIEYSGILRSLTSDSEIPVKIPYTERYDPESPNFVPSPEPITYWQDDIIEGEILNERPVQAISHPQISLARELFTPQDIETPDGRVSATDVRKIQQMLEAQAEAGRPYDSTIQKAIWGYKGGNAYKLFHAVKQELGYGE